MQEINLLKDELKSKVGFPVGRGWTTTLYIVISILVLEVLTYGFLIFDQKRTTARTLATEQETAKLDLEVEKFNEQRLAAQSFQVRLRNLETLLENHLYWSVVLGELEKFTYIPAKYNSLEVNEAKHTFILSGTIPSYTDLAKLMLGFKQSSYFQDVKLQSSF